MSLFSAALKLPGNIVRQIVDDVSGENDGPYSAVNQGSAIASLGVVSVLRAIKKTSDEEL